MDFQAVKDSGTREAFPTGSQRDTRAGKGRYDLIPPMFLKRLARHLENGAAKYGDNNWQLGQPLSRYYDAAMRHMLQWYEGKADEDHGIAAVWNLMAALWTEEQAGETLPEELDDRPVKWTPSEFEAAMAELQENFNKSLVNAMMGMFAPPESKSHGDK